MCFCLVLPTIAHILSITHHSVPQKNVSLSFFLQCIYVFFSLGVFSGNDKVENIKDEPAKLSVGHIAGISAAGLCAAGAVAGVTTRSKFRKSRLDAIEIWTASINQYPLCLAMDDLCERV